MLIYCRSILAILAWVILLNGIVVSQVPVFENVDPTVSQLEVIRGSGDPDYSGDLNVNIPLMTVPGRGGLNFNINLQYVHGNGVPASESASWVGLGWNLNMYQITCSPTYDPDIASSGSLLSDDKDMYYLSYPGGATPFRKFADDWTPLNWSAIKIEASILTTPGGNNPDQDYERFVVTDLDGTRYVFGHKLKMESQNQLSNHCIPNSGSVQCAHTNGHPYFYVFKLTAILGPNYVDAGGDAYVPGDVGTDSGSWIKLDYWDPITITADGSIIQMEASFLKTITTPTHQASFTLTSSYNNAIIYRGLQKENLPSLDKIQLKKLGGTLIREVDFTTSESFGWVKENSGPGQSYNYVYNPRGISYGELRRRLRLDSVTIYGQNPQESQPPYTFTYYGEPTDLADYAPCWLDPWGLIATVNSSSDAYQNSPDPNRDYCWMLKKIIYPTGGSVEFEYETDRYEIPYPDVDEGNLGGVTRVDYMGGVRLLRQTITDPLTLQQSVYSYSYALTNTDFPGGFGFSSGRIKRNLQNGVLFGNGIGANYSNDVHYPDVEITRPDNSRIRKYFSCAFSGLGRGSYISSKYSKSYLTVTINEDDPYIHDTSVIDPNLFDAAHSNLHNNLYLQFQEYEAPAYPGDYFMPDKYFRQNSYYYEMSSAYSPEYTALRLEATEYDGHDYIALDSYVQLFDNKWKRGHLTEKEYYAANSTTPVQREKYDYTMKPVKTELLKYVMYNGSGNSFTYPGFVTSGWAQLTKIRTESRLDPNSTSLYLFGEENYEYNTMNGLIKKQTDINNSNGTQRITKFKYPVDYTNTTGAGDVYEQALHAMRTTKHIYSPVIEKEIRELPFGQSEKLVAAELVKYKQFGSSGQYFPHEIKRFSNPTSVTDFVESNITAGTFTSDSRYLLQARNDQYDLHGNPTLVYDATNTPTSTLWAYNNALPIAQVRNATPTNAMVSVFDDNNTSGWANGAGTWVAGNGAYQQTDSLPNSITQPQRYNNLTLDDAVLEADVRFDNITKPQRLAICKYVDGSNVVRFVLRRETSNPVVRIYAQKGTSTKIVDAPKTFNAKQWYHLRGEIEGSTARLYLDGDLLLTLTDPTVDHGAGKIGLGTELSQASFDNVRFYPPNALVLSRSFDPGFFKVNMRTDENGMSRRFTFDALGRLKTVQDALGNLAQNTAYYYSSPFSTSNPNYIKTTLATNAALHVRNHDFESGTVSQPDYWIGEVIGTTCSGCAAAWDNTVSFSGAKAIKAHIPAAGADSRVRWMTNPCYDEKVSPKETYRMEVWVKTANGYNGNAKFILWLHNSAHGFTESPTITIPAGDREWTKYTLDFTPLPDTDHLYTIYLDFASNNQYKGTVWYDLANFYELNTIKTFADGLGRGVQTLQYQGDNSSVQVATVFDALSRVSKVTKSFFSADTFFTPAYNTATQTYPTIDSANTWYSSSAQKHPAYFDGSWADPSQYDTAPYAFSETAYYNDPLDRVQKQAAPGTAFRMGTSREVKFHYFGNASGEVPTYTANALMKQRRTDENGNVVSTITDNFGHTIATIVDSAGLNLKTTFQYDVLGNLLKSKAPKGDSTTYAYNTLSQLRQKITPDAGTTEYLYDQNGNLRLVKDANGAAGSYFIYYKYDAFNRKIEEGRVNSLASFRQDSANIAAFPTTGHTWKVKYHYDVAGYAAGAPQRNLRGRMDAVEYAIDRYPNRKGYLFYSYDNNGNLEWLQQFIPKSNINDGNGNLVAMINYSYDALGKVTKMFYRRTFPPGGPSDAFYVWYDYDALGRLEKVFANTIDLKIDPPAAQYTYWPSGQVRRVVLGNNLQGVDYLYNSRDWLTQINHQNLYYTQDPGGDGGGAGVPNADRFGQIIGYDKQKGLALGHSDFFAQYNGNISWTYHKTFGNTQPVNSGITGWVFRYDKANRLVKGNWGHWNNSGSYWQLSRRYDVTGRTAPDSLIEYDANGNLEYMIRFDQNNAPTLMDYSYLANSNKLNYVGGLNGQSSGNYVYDNNGNMIKDVAKLGSGNTISYDYRNLPYKVPTTGGTIDFGYDGKGQRVSKNNLFYVPGADGRVIAVYDDKGTLLYWNIWGLDLIGQRFWKQ